MSNIHSRRRSRGKPASGNIMRLLLCGLTFFAVSSRAEQVGDISVSSQAMHSGNTYHGYAEVRVVLENKSAARAHRVTLDFPARPYSYGNTLSRVSRTVMLAPSSRVVTPLWQPPLAANGDSELRVQVDGEKPQTISLPNGNSHMSKTGRYYGGVTPAVILVSRDLNVADLERLRPENDGFTAAMATGAPNANNSYSASRAWKPDDRITTGTNWLELTYDRPMVADRLRIYSPDYPSFSGNAILRNSSNAVIATVPLAGGLTTYSSSRGSDSAISFPQTAEPVAQVRLEFDHMSASAIAVDAVQLANPSNSTWAAEAQASSDAGYQATSSSHGGSSGESLVNLRAEAPVSDWSENWLAYTPYDAIALKGSELIALPPGVAAAVWRYVEAGGNILLVGGGQPPEPWRSVRVSAINGLENHHVGFGHCVSLPVTMADLSPGTTKQLQELLKNAARYWDGLPSDANSANSQFPVVDAVRIPARGIVIVMLAFIILIGPANLIILSRHKRRTWLLWTIPAISLATTALFFIYSAVHEGFTPDTRTRGLTILDQANHRATTVGVEGYYCPLTPGGGLTFGYETELTPLVTREYSGIGFGSGSGGREVDWTQAQQLRRGWVSARVPAHFHIRKSETRRERLELERNGENLEAVNGLGGTIQKLYVADASGRIFTASQVAAGQKIRLSPQPSLHVREARGPADLLQTCGYTVASLDDPVPYLTPGSYYATLDSNPFLENGLGEKTTARHKRDSAVIFGLLGTDAK